MSKNRERLPLIPVSGNQIPEHFPPLSKIFFRNRKITAPKRARKKSHHHPYRKTLSEKNLSPKPLSWKNRARRKIFKRGRHKSVRKFKG